MFRLTVRLPFILTLTASLLLVFGTELAVAQHTDSVAVGGETPRLTLEKLFNSPEFSGDFFRGGRWADEGPELLYIESGSENGATSLTRLNLETDEETVLIDGTTLRKSDTGDSLTIESYEYSKDGTKALLYTDSERVWRRNTKGFYYVYDLESGALKPVSDREDGFQMFAKFNADANSVAFVRDRDIFVANLDSGEERALTDSGSEGGVINGTFDWVYEEEFGLRDGFRWSPSGDQIAFWQLDESAEREFTMTDFTTLYPELEAFKYPKAGEENAQVRIGVADVKTGETLFFDTGTWVDGEEARAEAARAAAENPEEEIEYIAAMGWTPPLADGESDVWMLRLNRNQNHVELLYGDAETGEVRTILTEENDSYIEVETGFSDVSTGTVTYLDDNEHFVWRSDRDGYSHLYLYTLDGNLIRQVTSGEWDVTDFHGIDEAADMVYVTGTRAGPLERHLYRVPLEGGDVEKITQAEGWHSVNLSRDFRYFIDNYSNVATPSTTTLFTTEGEEVKVLVDNHELIERLAAYDLPPAEFLEVPAADGTPLNAYLIKPSEFDPSREYPLLIHTYGGPGSQEVVNRWGGGERLWHHYLAETYGILIAGVDNRGTGGRGKEFKTLTQYNLGPMEAQDQIAAAKHFGAMDFVDAERLGIWGWSYGGYLTLLALTYEEGPETFHVGGAVAPVGTWRHYDTIYTERYLSTPQNNPEGYDGGSPVTYASRLANDQELLIAHGDADDNVHLQNTLTMVDALIAANKQFDLMIYPGRNHGIYGGNTRRHLYTMLTEFFAENLAGMELAAVE